MSIIEYATKIAKQLETEPQLTVDQIADKFDLPTEDVVGILDEFFVHDDGDIEHLGTGRGGGWHPARLAEKERAAQQIELIDQQIAERQAIFDALPEDDESRIVVNGWLSELRSQRAELEGA